MDTIMNMIMLNGKKKQKIIVDIKGGVGNQLFCYAFGYALSKELGMKLYIDTSMPDNDNVKDRKLELLNYSVTYDKRISYKYRKSGLFKKLGINRICKKNAIGWFTKHYLEKREYEYDENVFRINHSAYFDGFWQNYRYFDKYREDIVLLFRPKEERNKNVYDLINEVESCNSVSLHVRRGDYVKLGWQLPMDYYDRALKRMKELIGENMVVYVFSDDMYFVKNYFRTNNLDKKYLCKYVEYESDNYVCDDMYIMSKCKHNITANSSYSWWAAYLNCGKDKQVISPVIGMWKREFYLQDWNCIEVNN